MREPNEFITSKISNATNIPLSELSNRQTDIPLNKKIVPFVVVEIDQL